jgi:hypothetical protein
MKSIKKCVSQLGCDKRNELLLCRKIGNEDVEMMEN